MAGPRSQRETRPPGCKQGYWGCLYACTFVGKVTRERRPGRGKKLARDEGSGDRLRPPDPRLNPVFTQCTLILRCAPAASGHVAAVPLMSVMNSRRLIAFPSRTSKNFDGTPRSVLRENSSGFRRLTLRNLNPFIVNVVP